MSAHDTWEWKGAPIGVDQLLRGERVVLCVSLANTVFCKLFASRLMDWLDAKGCRQLLVILGDQLESINMQVFRDLVAPEAIAIARRRADDLARMFTKAATNRRTAVLPLRQSQCDAYTSPRFSEICRALRAAFDAGGRFQTDVEEQVLTNLEQRRRKYGDDFIMKRLNAVSQYVIEELAFLYTLFSEQRSVIEVYPGNRMQTAAALYAGAYRNETGVTGLDNVPPFIDVSFLSDHAQRHASA